MKTDFQHVALLVVLVLALAATVALTVAHIPVPDVLQYVDTATAGALFGVTLPGGRAGGEDVTP